jgi:hypothetical protein
MDEDAIMQENKHSCGLGWAVSLLHITEQHHVVDMA